MNGRVDAGQWLLYCYHPDRAEHGENPMLLDSKMPNIPVKTYMDIENRFKMLSFSKPQVAKELAVLAQSDVDQR